MADLKDVVLFKVGRWNGIDVDEAMLDDIASNYAMLKNEMRIPLKLGHRGKSKDQLAGDKTLEQPALGFAENIRRVGNKLLADFRDVPGIVLESIKRKLYSGLSIELLRGVKFQGKVLGNILDAVALLGVSAPAVSGLKDLATYLATRKCFEAQGKRVVFEFQDRPNIDEATVKAMIAEAMEPVQAENKDLKAQLEVEKKKSATFEREKQERQADDVKARRAKAEAIIENAVKSNKITPAKRETFARLFQLEDDKVVMREGLLEEIEAAFANTATLAFGSESVAYSDPHTFERERDVFAETDRRTKKIMNAQGLDYRTALHQVFANDPALHREYIETTPPENVRPG